MKNVKKVIVAALLIGLVAAPMSAAGNGTKPDKSKEAKNSVRFQLEQALSDIPNTVTGSVSVYFNVTSKGSFELLKVEGENPDLIKDVSYVLKQSAIHASKYLDGQFCVKISFINNESVSTSSIEPAKDVLRDEIAGLLSSVKTDQAGSVTILFKVKDGIFEVQKVDGNSELASAVKNTLTSNSITVPADLSGFYQVDVHF
jgi:hypothetical protein